MKLKITFFFLLTALTLQQINAQCWESAIAGRGYTLAISNEGSLWASGENAAGQLGDGTLASNPVQHQIGTATDWQFVNAGHNHSLGIKTDGTLWSWGINDFGQLGNGTNESSHTPQQVGPDTDWLIAKAGVLHSIALKVDGTLWTWGANMFSQLGNGNNTNSNVPLQIGSDTNWVSVTVSDNGSHNLALKADGTLWSWGFNANGQLGVGSTSFLNNPTQVGIADDWAVICAGSGHSLGIKTNGELWAWGQNQSGELGNETTFEFTPTPTRIGTETDWAQIGAGSFYTTALKTDGSLWAWGYNLDGQVGTGDGTSFVLAPRQIGTDTNWVTIESGSGHTAALNTNGELWAWGINNAGGLGDGTTTGRAVPTIINCPADLGIGTVELSTIEMYPNPAINTVKFTFPVEKIEVYNLQGKKLDVAYTSTEANVSALQTGIYIIIGMDSNGVTFSLKLMKK